MTKKINPAMLIVAFLFSLAGIVLAIALQLQYLNDMVKQQQFELQLKEQQNQILIEKVIAEEEKQWNTRLISLKTVPDDDPSRGTY